MSSLLSGSKRDPLTMANLSSLSSKGAIMNTSYMIKEAFSFLDHDLDGEISHSDLHKFFSVASSSSPSWLSRSMRPCEEEIRTMISVADANGNGSVDFTEFEDLSSPSNCSSSSLYYSQLSSWAHPHSQPQPQPSSSLSSIGGGSLLWEMFEALDCNGDGGVCKEDLKRVFKMVGQDLEEENLQFMVDLARNLNRDNPSSSSSSIEVVCFDNFLNLMTSII